jgi:hypothetical protein
MIALLVLVSLYLVFFMYLMFAGAGFMRTLSVLRVAAWQGALAGLVVGGVVALFSVAGGAQAFLTVMTLMSLIVLPTAALSRARDFILPSSSVFEVVCLNALVVAIGHPPHSFPFFDTLFQGAFHLLLNPFASFMPVWLGTALCFWPSALALRLAAQGERASLKSRFFMNLWVQMMSIIWVLPAAIGSFNQFKGESPMDYVEILFACLSLVYVVLTWMTLRDAVLGKRTVMIDERSLDSTERIGVARALADRMDPGRWPPIAHVTAGIATYLITWTALLAYLDPGTAATVGFMTVVVAGALAGRSPAQRADEVPGPKIFRWYVSAGLLAAVIALFQPISMKLLGQRQRDVFSLDHAEQRAPQDLRAVDASARHCEIERADTLRLRCPKEIWYLGAVRHPANLANPLRVDMDQAREFALLFGRRTLHCVEIPVSTRPPEGAPADSVMLLVYVPNTQTGRQYGWVIDRDASCSRLVELRRSRLVGLLPLIGYPWRPETAKLRNERIGSISEFNEPEPVK